MIPLATRTAWYWAAARFLRREPDRIPKTARRVLEAVALKSKGPLRERAFETLIATDTDQEIFEDDEPTG